MDHPYLHWNLFRSCKYVQGVFLCSRHQRTNAFIRRLTPLCALFAGAYAILHAHFAQIIATAFPATHGRRIRTKIRLLGRDEQLAIANAQISLKVKRIINSTF